MPIVSGDFTATDLRQSILRADQMWTDDMMRADYEANTDIWNAIRAEQNASVTLLQDSEKDRDVKVVWANMCGETAEDADADDCDLAGNELGTDSKVYSLGFEKQWKFTVDELMFRSQENVSFAEIVAKGMMKGDKILSEAICASAIARVESFKGTNVVTDGVGTVNGVTTETDIAAADWNERLFAYLYRVGLQNELSNPFLLSGTNMFEDWLVVQANRANGEGKGAANLYAMMRTYFDLFNIDPANSPNLKTYLINRGSIAFASKNYYGATPVKYKEQDRYSIASRNLPGVRYDVFYTNRCSGTTIMHDFKMKAKYDYFLNPTGCDGARTGVLAFNRTA